MTILTELQAQGIVLNITLGKEPEYKIQCDCPQPYCKKTRAATNKTPLNILIEQPKNYAEWRCSHCLWTGHIGDKPETVEAASEDDIPIAAPRTPKSLPNDALAFLAAKGMTEEDATKFKLSWDATKKVIKIPYFEGGQIVNYAVIRISDGKSKLENPNRATFFGIDQLPNNNQPVIIAHREIDAIVLMQRGFESVIGVPNGADIKPTPDDFNKEPDRFAFLSNASTRAKQWFKIVFACDDTKEGLALRQELARRLGAGRCASAKPSRVSIGQTQAELGADMVCADINEARDLPILGIFSVDDFEGELEAYFNYGMSSGVSTGWKNVDKLYTIMPGQFSVVTGIPNSGKSEWLDALSVNLALEFNWRFAVFSPENGKEAQATKLIEKRTEFPADPKAYRRMSIDTFKSGARWVNEHYTFIESKDAMPTLDWILERAKDAVMRFGIKGLIIDPWNLIEKVLAGKSETDYVAESLPKIRRFAANYGVHVWLVVHPKQQQKNPKTGNIDAPSLYDMAGSAHFVNMCDNGIVVHRSSALDDTSEILVNKVRFKHVGKRGSTKLRYDLNSGRYSQIEEELSAQQLASAERLKAASNGDEIDVIKTYEAQ